ncbi:MAG: prepilin-type N-terminal cleavage/methylation domain-containing protein [Deltaproteobacteria bacterium]|nr:prepilin-type N-terminal cleavage/methylation domain-containing protein [Deltaproteobacteria bacterium]
MTTLKARTSKQDQGQWTRDKGPKTGRFSSPRSNRGFTLCELLVTVAIVGLIMGLAVGQMGRVLSWDMKAASRKLSSTIKYLYNKSAMEGVTLRLVFDIDGASYWVEGTSSENFAITKEEEERTKDHGPGTEDEKPEETVFTPQESHLLKQITLPKGVFFKDIYSEHQHDRLDSGKAYIYFFPRGYVERSVINLRDAKDDVHYSLTVNPLSGSVKIESEYKEAEVER